MKNFSDLDNKLKNENKKIETSKQKEETQKKQQKIKYTILQFLTDAKKFVSTPFVRGKDLVCAKVDEKTFLKEYNSKCKEIYQNYLVFAELSKDKTGFEKIDGKDCESHEIIYTKDYGPFIKTKLKQNQENNQYQPEYAYVGFAKNKDGVYEFFYLTLCSSKIETKYAFSKNKIYSYDGLINPQNGKITMQYDSVPSLAGFPLEFKFRTLKSTATKPAQPENDEKYEIIKF